MSLVVALASLRFDKLCFFLAMAVAEANTSNAKQSQATPSRAKQSKANQGKAKQGKAEQSKAKHKQSKSNCDATRVTCYPRAGVPHVTPRRACHMLPMIMDDDG